jgi:hypothetical protein
MLSNKRIQLGVIATLVCILASVVSTMATAEASTRSQTSALAPNSVRAVDVAARAKNVNFKGTWVTSSGNWTVKTENLKTGACTGTTAFVGYSFSGCKVTGNKYRFVIAQIGTSYRSINTGTISGNTVKGSFNDGRGPNPYVAYRK